MGRKHQAAAAGIARAQADEELREAATRRESAERERQLLTSYLGTEEQVAGTGRFNVDPNVLKFTQRYTVDARTLADIAAAGSGIKNQGNPFQMAGSVELGQGFANQANDLLAQAEAAARAGDFTRADQLYAQAQQIISGVSPEAQGAFNLGGGEDSAAAIRAGSAEGRIVGRQLLTAQQLGDPNSATSTQLRGRLLDPALAAIDENTRNAERAITAERSQIEGDIRQRSAGGGTGVSARAQLALESQAASQAALQRAVTYSDAGAQRAVLTAQVNQYLNEFTKRMAEDSVRIAQAWVDGTAGVRDEFQESLTQLNVMSAQLANQWALIFAAQAEARRKEDKIAKQVRREFFGFGLPTGALAVSTIFGGKGVGQTAAGVDSSSTGVGAAADLGGGGDFMPEGGGDFMPSGGGGGSSTPMPGVGGGGGGGGLGALASLFSFL